MRLTLVLLLMGAFMAAGAQETVTVRPKETDSVLVNPGMGLIAALPWAGMSRQGPRLPGDPQSRSSLSFLSVYWKALGELLVSVRKPR